MNDSLEASHCVTQALPLSLHSYPFSPSLTKTIVVFARPLKQNKQTNKKKSQPLWSTSYLCFSHCSSYSGTKETRVVITTNNVTDNDLPNIMFTFFSIPCKVIYMMSLFLYVEGTTLNVLFFIDS